MHSLIHSDSQPLKTFVHQISRNQLWPTDVQQFHIIGESANRVGNPKNTDPSRQPAHAPNLTGSAQVLKLPSVLHRWQDCQLSWLTKQKHTSRVQATSPQLVLVMADVLDQHNTKRAGRSTMGTQESYNPPVPV